MARLHLAFFLLFVAVSALIVSASDRPPSTTTAGAPTATNPTNGGDVAEGPSDDNAIGTTDDDTDATPGDDDVAVAGPIGSDSSYANYPPPQQTAGSNSLLATIGFTSVAAAMAGSLFFF